MKSHSFSKISFTDLILDRIQAGAQSLLQLGIVLLLSASLASLLFVICVTVASLF